MRSDKIIQLNQEELRTLIDEVIEYIKCSHNLTGTDWLSVEETMRLLNVSSPTTLARLRNEGKIKYTQPMRKVILYSRQSILGYLEKHAKHTF